MIKRFLDIEEYMYRIYRLKIVYVNYKYYNKYKILYKLFYKNFCCKCNNFFNCRM